MRIVDLRPAPERHFTKAWNAGGPNPVASAQGGNPATRLWAQLADAYMGRRVRQRPDPPHGPFVVSVGNLALGGTGKTPVIMALARDLARDQHQGCVLTRGFKSSLRGPLVVTPDQILAGDEARLMADRLADLAWPVVQSRDRSLGMGFILENFPDLDFVLLEDGHQTRNLGRHLDILILDRWGEQTGSQGPVLQPVTASVFPWGPYRESARGARRADVLLVESGEKIPPRGIDGQVTATYSRRLALSQVALPTSSAEPLGPYAALSGIARPERFESGLEQMMGYAPEVSVRLGDHQEYSPRLVRKIIQELEGEPGLPLITTAKDWVKLESLWPTERSALVADLEISWGGAKALPQLVRERSQ